MIVNIMIWILIAAQFFSIYKMRQCKLQVVDDETKNFIKWSLIGIFAGGVVIGHWIFKLVDWIFGG